MKTRKVFRLVPWVCALFLVVFCLGCETVKGMGRDVKNADQWMKDHAW